MVYWINCPREFGISPHVLVLYTQAHSTQKPSTLIGIFYNHRYAFSCVTVSPTFFQPFFFVLFAISAHVSIWHVLIFARAATNFTYQFYPILLIGEVYVTGITLPCFCHFFFFTLSWRVAKVVSPQSFT
jgi:hypothetical protein